MPAATPGKFGGRKCSKRHPFGDKVYPPDAIQDSMPAEKACRPGGGGLARKFVSYFSKMFRLDKGKFDLTTIWQIYKAEKAKPYSPLLESMRAGADLATRARRQQRSLGRASAVSSFGDGVLDTKGHHARM